MKSAARASARAGQAASAGPSQALAGIANIVVAVGLFAAMDALVKHLSPVYPVLQLVFFRSFFAFVPLSLLLLRAGGLGALATARPLGHVLRSLAGLASMLLFFLAFALLPLAEAIALSFAGPLFLTVLSIPLLGEKVGGRRWAAVLLGFVGVMLIVRPGAGVFGWVAAIPLGAALTYAFAMIFVRKLARSESNAAIVFYFTLSCTVVSALGLPFVWVQPALADLPALVGVGLLGGAAQLFMTQAFRLAPAAVVAPFEYLAILFGIGFGYAFWGEIPDGWTLGGAAVVVASGLYILRRETIRRAERGLSPAGPAGASPAPGRHPPSASPS